jgi:hypothetical protein
MSLLVFCSIDVGGFPFSFADILNRHGVPTYFICTSDEGGHDSAAFHVDSTATPWNLSRDFNAPVMTRRERAVRLREIVRQRGITDCFATGTDIGVLREAGVRYKYWSYGNDLDVCCWPSPPVRLTRLSEMARYAARCALAATRIHGARRCLRSADAAMISPYQHDTFRVVVGNLPLFFFPHVLAVQDLEAALATKARVGERLRREHDADHVFFSSTRQFWNTQSGTHLDDKGNDVMIRAFAIHRRREQGKGSKLLFVDKGRSVPDSKALAESLGIGADVRWLAEMPRGELSDYYAGADLCFGQFGVPVLSFSTLEPMAYATPVVSYMDETSPVRVPYFPEPPVMFNSREPIAIADFLQEVCSSDERRRELSIRTWEWTDRNCREKHFVEAIKKALNVGEP